MTTPHTPGPWFAHASLVYSAAIDRFFVFCHSKDLPGGREEAPANARLIAEAPALAVALRWALEQIEDSLDPEHQAALAEAQATLHRATGA